MSWDVYRTGYKSFLKLEKALSDNTVENYLRDLDKLISYAKDNKLKANSCTQENIFEFINEISKTSLSPRSKARLISGVKSFFNYLLLEEVIDDNPADLVQTPKIAKTLPDTLSLEEIETLISSFDLSKPDGYRNKTIIETLYSCGLRVSELINLKISELHFDDDFIVITGKGNKQRIVPIGNHCKKLITSYRENYRVHLDIKKGQEDFVFLSKNGSKISRIMIFMIVKKAAENIGLKKNISPHTFRHSFASHLVDGGADLRAVQEMLGHESITTTEIYTHLNRDYLKSAIIEFHPRASKV